MKLGDTVKHLLTGISGEVTNIFQDVVTFYSNGHYLHALSDTLKVIHKS